MTATFECTAVGESPRHYNASTATLRQDDYTAGWIEVVGTDPLLDMLRAGKRYRITVEEVSVVS